METTEWNWNYTHEKDKHKLKEVIAIGGVKGMSAKHELAILEAGNCHSDMERALIRAEASLRKASSQHQEGIEKEPVLKGSVWWIERDIQNKKKLYAKLKR